MSKKKKLAEEQARLEAEQNARKNRVRIGYTIVNPLGRPVPVARPSASIQLTPIVQPIAMVPYSTQQQPLLSDVSDDEE